MNNHEFPHEPIPAPDEVLQEHHLAYEPAQKPEVFTETTLAAPSRLRLVAGSAVRATAEAINKLGAPTVPIASAQHVEDVRARAKKKYPPRDNHLQ